MKIINLLVDEIVPYANNPRNNEDTVDAVAESIRQFGFLVPIVIDRDNVIAAGHTRLLAAKKIGMDRVPCVKAEDLTGEQIRAFRLADNKTAEIATWDFEKMDIEIAQIETFDMASFGFKSSSHEWFDRESMDGRDPEEGNDEYNEFIDKFVPKKTTDDCYTPDLVYDAIAEWVANEYKLKRTDFVRPFYPGGDYQGENYPPRCVVVDNPPFSILSEIIKFYTERGIKFFLFAPALTVFSSTASRCCALCIGATITYENGAEVSTSFVTNLDDQHVAMSTPELYRIIKEANDKGKEQKKELPKYRYPDNVVTASMLNHMSKHDVALSINREDSARIRQLDAQKENGDVIFGNGFLLSEKAAEEKAAAEKAAAEKAAAEKAAAEKAAAEKVDRRVFALSDREKEIVKSLGVKDSDD